MSPFLGVRGAAVLVKQMLWVSVVDCRCKPTRCHRNMWTTEWVFSQVVQADCILHEAQYVCVYRIHLTNPWCVRSVSSAVISSLWGTFFSACVSAKVARKRLDRLLCMANLLSSSNIEVKADLCDCQYTGSIGLCYASERVEWKGIRANIYSSYAACVILCKQASVRGSPAGTPAQICLCILKFVLHMLCNHLTWAIEWLKVLVGYGSFCRGQSAWITRGETTDVSAAIRFKKKVTWRQSQPLDMRVSLQ